MAGKSSCEDLKRRVRELEKEILDRNKVEAELRNSEERFRELAEHFPEIVFEMNERGLLTFVNKKSYEITGYGKEDVEKGFRGVNLFVPAHRKRAKANILELMKGGEVGISEYTARRKDGTEFPIMVRSTPILKDGRAVGLRGIILDITDRKQAEERLKESEEKYRQLFSTESDAILLFYADTGQFFDANDAASKLYGYTKEEFLKLKVEDISADPVATRNSVRKTIAGKLTKIPLRYHKRKDGKPFPVEISSSTFMLGNQKVVCGTLRDISQRMKMEEELRKHRDQLEKLVEERTAELKAANRQLRKEVGERKRADQARRESERQYSKLVESSLTGIYIVQEDRVVFANNRFAEIHGYPRKELEGLESWKLVHPKDRAAVERFRKKRIKGEKAPSEYEIRGLTRDGETIWVKRRNTRIDYNGEPAVLGNVVDITERKRAEEQLRRTNKELENFVHVVSHDLKNPIFSIQGFTSRLFKNYQEKLGPRGAGYLGQIKTSAKRMEELVSDLLELSKVGRVVSTFEDVPSGQIVRDVASALQDRLNENRIQLIVSDDLPTIRCDRGRIQQVFENLIVNAVRFVGSTRNPKIRIGYTDQGTLHEFHVKDNGIGIHPKDHRTIFEMFHQVGKEKGQTGTGLGLAIVERIVKNHGGDIWVDSKTGKGATFYFTLPKTP